MVAAAEPQKPPVERRDVSAAITFSGRPSETRTFFPLPFEPRKTQVATAESQLTADVAFDGFVSGNSIAADVKGPDSVSPVKPLAYNRPHSYRFRAFPWHGLSWLIDDVRDSPHDPVAKVPN